MPSRGPRKKIDYEAHIGTSVYAWHILEVIVSLAEIKRPIYFRAQCIGCGTEQTQYAGLILNGRSRACSACTERETNAARAAKPQPPPRAHKTEVIRIAGAPVTICARCGMQPDFPGWSNACGQPLGTVKRMASSEAA